jgi:hypothetical protein
MFRLILRRHLGDKYGNIYIHTYVHTYIHKYIRGNINSYLHRFKISDTPYCPCGTQDQTTDHLLYECELSGQERNDLTTTIRKTDVWPASKPDLIKKHIKTYQFTNAIVIDKLRTKRNGNCNT